MIGKGLIAIVKNDGIWKGKRILPEGWGRYISTPTAGAPKGEYGAHFWLNYGEKGNRQNRTFPGLPSDMIYLSGYNEQIVAVLPSNDLIVVRFGATQDDSWDDEKFIKSIINIIEAKK